MTKFLKLFACIVLIPLFSACTTNNLSKPLYLQSAYQERGININRLGQLEPESLTECNVDNYYWTAHGPLNESTLDYHYSLHFKGIMLNLVEENDELYVATPNSPFKATKTLKTALPLLNQTLAASIKDDTQFIVKIEQVSNTASLQALSNMLTESNNAKNITLIANNKQKRFLSKNLPQNTPLFSEVPKEIKTTHLNMLSLCQSLNDDLVIESYVSNEILLQRLEDNNISFAELIETLPHNANFSDLQYQQALWENKQYQRFDGTLTNIIQEKEVYKEEEIDRAKIKRNKESIRSQKKIIFKISQ